MEWSFVLTPVGAAFVGGFWLARNDIAVTKTAIPEVGVRDLSALLRY
jgi:hypothetical protein